MRKKHVIYYWGNQLELPLLTRPATQPYPPSNTIQSGPVMTEATFLIRLAVIPFQRSPIIVISSACSGGADTQWLKITARYPQEDLILLRFDRKLRRGNDVVQQTASPRSQSLWWEVAPRGAHADITLPSGPPLHRRAEGGHHLSRAGRNHYIRGFLLYLVFYRWNLFGKQTNKLA